jgi:hypothetical protein
MRRSSEDIMPPRTTCHSLRNSREEGGTAMRTLERKIAELAQLADSQSRELRIQFERIAQMQAEWDVLRIRLTKP